MPPPTPPVKLEWVAPAECPSQSDVMDAIERMLGEGPLRSAVEAHVAVTPEGSEFRAEVTVSASGATSSRSLVGESCRAVADAATIIVALAAHFDPAPPAPPPAVPAPVAAMPSAAASPSAPRARTVFLQGSLVLDSDLLPSASWGGELGAGWDWAHVDLELAGAIVASRRATLASTPSQGADLWLAHLGTRACYEPLDGPFDVGPCVGAGLEWITARGYGTPPDQPSNATGRIGVASLGGRATYRLSSRFALRLVGEAVLPLMRPTFVIDGGGQVFHTPPASFRATAGAEAHF